MKISSDQIEKKAIAGKTTDGKPVVYIATKGGLHAFFMKDEDGSISSIGAAPHRAIAKYLASKKHDIKWKEDFHKSEDLTKSEGELFQRMRNAILTPLSTNGDKTGVYMVYDINKGSIEVMRKSDLMEELKSGTVSRYAMVRDTSLSSPVTLAQDCEDLKEDQDG
jgi:hypothetical protein